MQVRLLERSLLVKMVLGLSIGVVVSHRHLYWARGQRAIPETASAANPGGKTNYWWI